MQRVSGVHIWLILMKAFHSIDARVSRSLRESQLGDSDFRVLEALLHKGPMPVNTIGEKVFLTSGSISTAVDRLLKRGLVVRLDNKDDRRVRIVELTAKGQKLISKLFSAHAQEMEALASVLSAEERSALVESLKKFGKHAAHDLQNERE
jgi:MarR family transcriptional regulator, 2-MHQ and catechol-resistance regulon repressor